MTRIGRHSAILPSSLVSCQTGETTRVLIVHHTVSPSLAELLDIVVTSAANAGMQLGVDLDLGRQATTLRAGGAHSVRSDRG
ncbi:MAG TPA: hypothetical protein DCQ04_04590 [Actinobacteria bacterium]|nr:hypothetical protein [Actinomycetota bacterium]